MAKSIRSKQKRKHRAEFRATIGHDAYVVNMKKIQEKLKATIERQSMKQSSLDRLSSTLESDNYHKMVLEDDNSNRNDSDDSNADNKTPLIDAMETNNATTSKEVDAKQFKGENKVPAKKLQRSFKHSKRHTRKEKEERPKPRYFCQF